MKAEVAPAAIHRMFAAAAAVALLVAATGAGAAPGHRVVVEPDWLIKPTGDQLERVFPPGAEAAGIGGRIRLSCKVRLDGGVDRCTIDQEDPPGWGFGDAALQLTPMMKLRPKTINGQAVDGGEADIPIRFAVEPDRAPPETVPPPSLAEAAAKDPESLSLARQISDQMAQFDIMPGALRYKFTAYISPLFARGHADPRHLQAITEAFGSTVNDYAKQRRDRLAAALVFRLTRPELVEIAAFMHSPSGRTFAHVFPVALSSSFARDDIASGAFVDALRTSYCAKVTCDDPDLAAFATLNNDFTRRRAPPTAAAKP
ncbi:MAG TPA: TonB family protein [Caulobacteraceae bacterium]|jgi:TonB family protein|nr:TonB family protein [Caulobacteraceae bacterium]